MKKYYAKVIQDAVSYSFEVYGDCYTSVCLTIDKYLDSCFADEILSVQIGDKIDDIFKIIVKGDEKNENLIGDYLASDFAKVFSKIHACYAVSDVVASGGDRKVSVGSRKAERIG